MLFELLAVLERMKKEVGPSDAVDIESVSSAYVENFGLRIFGMADNEDRKGEATRFVIHQCAKLEILTHYTIHRATAKKFLAAANFLEVLKIFPKTPISEAVRGSRSSISAYNVDVSLYRAKRKSSIRNGKLLISLKLSAKVASQIQDQQAPLRHWNPHLLLVPHLDHHSQL